MPWSTRHHAIAMQLERAGLMEQADKIDQLAAALVAFQAEMPAVPKNSTNPFYQSKYADLADVVETAKPFLAKHGLAVSQFLSHDEERNTLVTWLLHSSGQYIKDEMLLMLPKDDPQGQGSAATYARRYAYSAALGIVTDSDDDGNAAASAPSRSQSAPARMCVRCKEPIVGPVKSVDGGYAHTDCVEPKDEEGSESRSPKQQELAAT